MYNFDQAVGCLSKAYLTVLLEFTAFARKKGTPVTLRLLPISGGIFAGEYNSPDKIAKMAALFASCELLAPQELLAPHGGGNG
mmetsp:Transcript_31717/g.86773  ORF Transcript_31717/g.86773 Transcript_31717/m.86773 type:complete len:83 (-) Transcript_31717:721-969(-)